MFTNSALWTLIVLGTIWVFMFGGMKRELIPGRWQVAVEGLIAFVDDMVNVSIGPEGKKYLPWVFTAFVFLLFANLMGNMPFGIVAAGAPVHRHQPVHLHRRHVADQFAIVLGVGFWKHGFTSSRCSCPRTRRSIFKFADRADRVR